MAVISPKLTPLMTKTVVFVGEEVQQHKGSFGWWVSQVGSFPMIITFDGSENQEILRTTWNA